MNDGVYDTRFFREMCERLGDVIGRDLEESASGAGPVLEQRSVEAILTALDFERVVAGGADLGELAAVVLAQLDPMEQQIVVELEVLEDHMILMEHLDFMLEAVLVLTAEIQAVL